jgi:hypothetical protein
MRIGEERTAGQGEEVITVKTMERWRLGQNKSWETGFVCTESYFWTRT